MQEQKTKRTLGLQARWLALIALFGLMGCAPEVGSDRWCEKMEGKPKGDWTANEALDYAEHCILD